MNTPTMKNPFALLRCALVVAGVLSAPSLLAGCGFEGGFNSENLSEGSRCNPFLSHNDCSAGAVCAGASPSTVTIPFCPENYCCSANNGAITSTNPNCQPGCNGGAAAMCAATGDPVTCAFADSGTVPPIDAGAG